MKVRIYVVRGQQGRSLCIGSTDRAIGWRLVGPKLDGNNAVECSFDVNGTELRGRITAILRQERNSHEEDKT